MDKKSKILTYSFSAIVLLSIVLTFYRYIVYQDINFLTDEEAFNEALLEE